jgi:two-component system chemotaxis sensor kinase CheA
MDNIQTDRGQPLLSYRQEMVPVYYLGDLLGFDQKQGWPERDGHLSILIVSHSQQRMALVVDKILREEEVVTKSFGYPLAGALKFVSGSTLLRAGEIGLIINIFDLFDEARGKHFKAQMTASPAADARKKIQVLVVDDSLTSRIVERNLLEQAGYEVELAEHAEEALEKTEKKNYDIFLVDIEMPGMDGFELTRRLKAEPKTRRTPVVIVSTRSTAEDKRKGIEAGAQGYVVKSKLEPADFIRLIKHLVGE